jgi:hypothetical protein
LRSTQAGAISSDLAIGAARVPGIFKWIETR